MLLRSPRSVVTVGLGLTLLVAGCTSPNPVPQGDPIRIGAPISLTGSQAQGGQMVDEGYQFCQDWVNAQGGIIIRGTGHRLDIIRTDDQGRASLSASIVERMVTQDGLKLLLGPSSNALTARDAQIADAHGIPMVAGAALSEGIFKNGNHNVFGVLAPASLQMRGVIDFALAHWAAPHSVAVIFANDSLSTELANETSVYAAGRGLNVVFFGDFPAGANNMAPELQAAAAAQPDLVLVTGQLRDSIRMMQQARDVNLQAQMFGFTEGPGQDGFVSSLRKAAEQVVGASQWTPGARTPVSTFLTSQEYATQYQARFGHSPDWQSASATAACLALQAAIGRAGSTDPGKVRAALTTLDLKTFFGRIKFDDRGANMAKTVYVVEVQHGASVVVWPAEAATARPQYPWSGWPK